MSFCELISTDTECNRRFRVGDKHPVEYLMDTSGVVYKILKNGEKVKLTEVDHKTKPWLKKSLMSAIRYEARCGLYQVSQTQKHVGVR